MACWYWSYQVLTALLAEAFGANSPGFLFQWSQNLLDALTSERCHEEALPHIPLSADDFLSAKFQLLVVQSEHARERIKGDASKKTLEGTFFDDSIVRGKKSFASAFLSNYFDRSAARPLKSSGDEQFLIPVEEVIGRAFVDAKQKGLQAPQGGAFAGLVRPIDQMQPFRTL